MHKFTFGPRHREHLFMSDAVILSAHTNRIELSWRHTDGDRNDNSDRSVGR